MAWNQPGNSNNNPWGKKPSAGGGDLDQAFKDWRKRIESLFGSGSGSGGGGGGGGGSSTPLLILGIVIIGGWMSTGFYQVKTGEQGVVQRFGKHVDTVGDGLGWRLPWPIETVTKVDVQGVATTSYKSRVLTAEPNMVELQVAVQYRIKNAEDYLFKVREPKDTLSEVSESAIREVVGRSDQQAILEAGRLKIAEDTRDIMQRTLDTYGAGIEVRKVNITDVQVPEAVQQSQRDSVKAKADRERAIKEAQAIANGIIPQSQGQAAKEIQDAEAYKSQIVAIATGEASRFSQLLTAYEKAPAVTRERMYIETIEYVLSRTRKVVIDPKAGNGNMLYLPLDKLIDRGRDADASSVTVRPSVTVEPDSTSGADSRTRVER
jgi:modulator of FtsH protease HflK